MRQLSILVISLMAFSAYEAFAQDLSEQGWQRYTEPNAGAELEYPAGIFSEDSDKKSPSGRVLVTRDGSARLLIGTLPNADKHSPRSYQKFIAQESYSGARFDYAPVSETWTVLSGTREQTMFYQKIIFTCSGRVISTFALTYPIVARALYDPIVERIEDSFRPTTKCDANDFAG